MKKKLQTVFTTEAWSKIEKLTEKANKDFSAGNISYSDVICELVLSGSIDVKVLQLKHSDWRRSLKAVASNKEMDIDAAIKSLMELKSSTKNKQKVIASEETVNAEPS